MKLVNNMMLAKFKILIINKNIVLYVKEIFISWFAKKNIDGSWNLFAIIKGNDCIMLNWEQV